MSDVRHYARTLAMQALFHLDAGGDDALENVFAAAGEGGAGEADDEVRRRARALAEGAWSRRAELDELIQLVSRHWDVSRMCGVDRAILRLACCELLTEGGASDAVVINEAIELAKEFGTAESPSFVNGLLDGIRRRRGPKGRGDT